VKKIMAIKKRSKIPVAAIASGVAGAALIGSAVAMSMRNERTRRKVEETLSDLRDKGAMVYQDLHQRSQEYMQNQRLAAAKGGKSTTKRKTAKKSKASSTKSKKSTKK
jgi:hypothetical protein